MCIIVVCKKGIEIPDRDVLLTCWVNNDHGAGVAWSDGQKTHLKKGFMTFEHLEEWIDSMRSNLLPCDVMIHFRLATHGSISQKNCHPFVVSDRIRDLQRVYYHGRDMILAHNGIVTGKDYNRKTKNDLSDTMIFTKRLHVLGVADKSIRAILQAGKFVLMYPDHMDMYGPFIEENGVMYSNDSYACEIISVGFDTKYCEHETECLKSGVCVHTQCDIFDEMRYGDPEFCPIADDYWCTKAKSNRIKYGVDDYWLYK